MNLQNITVRSSSGKKISSIMFAGDFNQLNQKLERMREQHPESVVEGFTYEPEGWTKTSSPVRELKFRHGNVEMWNVGRIWIVTEDNRHFVRQNEQQARQILHEILEGV